METDEWCINKSQFLNHCNYNYVYKSKDFLAYSQNIFYLPLAGLNYAFWWGSECQNAKRTQESIALAHEVSRKSRNNSGRGLVVINVIFCTVPISRKFEPFKDNALILCPRKFSKYIGDSCSMVISHFSLSDLLSERPQRRKLWIVAVSPGGNTCKFKVVDKESTGNIPVFVKEISIGATEKVP